MLRGTLHAITPAILGMVAIAWGCGGDDDGNATPNDGDGGASTSSGGASSGASSSGAASSSGGSSGASSGADGSVPDPNPVLLVSGTQITQLQVFGTRGFARISQPTNGTEEWSTDFTKAGTKLLIQACPGCAADPHPLSALPNGKLFFAAKTGTAATAKALFVSDGTPAGTSVLASGGYDPAVVAGTKIVFRSSNTAVSVSDGTVAGTSALKNLDPEFFGDENVSLSIGNRAFFHILHDPGGGGSYTRRVFATDGTADATVQIGSGQFVSYLARAGNIAFMETDSFAPMAFLGTATISVSDGTVAGTKSLSPSFLTTPGISDAVAVGAALYFTAKGLNMGDPTALYKADASTITKVADGFVSNMIAFADKATYVSTSKIMQTDGTTPVMYYDASPGYPQNLTVIGTALWFTLGSELWKVEGATPTATKIATFTGDCPTCSNTAQSGVALFVSGTRIFALRSFTESDATKRPTALWFSDGTSAGTKLLKSSGALDVVPTPSGVMWTNGTELWHEKP